MGVEASIFLAAFGGGAASGAVIGIIEFIRWLRSRPLLKVSMDIGEIRGTVPYLSTSTGPSAKPEYVFFTARNPHSIPVTVSTFGLSYKSKAWGQMQVDPRLVSGYDFPYEVAGGKSLTEWKHVQDLLTSLRSAGRKPSDLKGVWFEASSGKVFHGKIDPKTIIALEKVFQTQ